MTYALLVGALLVARLGVASNSNCPSSRDIDSNLSVLMSDDAGPSGTVLVTAGVEGLLIDMRPEGAMLGAQRTVAVGSDCEERAKAAAVVIATWWPGRADRPAQAVAVSEVSQARASRAHVALSAGVFASMVSDGISPGIRIEGAWSPVNRPFGLRLSASGVGAQSASLGNGRVSYWRASAELGPTYTYRSLRLDVGGLLSVLKIQGSEYSENQSPTGASVGATAGVRLGWAWGRALPWLELRGMLWPQSQRITVLDSATGTETSRPIPRAELQLGAGVALSLP
jgi:hypothetical protein